MECHELPDGWCFRSLSEIADIVSGGTPSTETPRFWENGTIPWATPTDITNNSDRVLRNTAQHITPEGLKNSSARLLPPSTLLMTSRATVGEIKVALEAVSTNQGFKNLVPNGDVDIWFLYYQIFLNKTRYARLGIGSTFLEVNKKETGKFSILLPPKSEQKKIAAILCGLDDCIDNTHSLIAKYNAIKQGMMQDLFTRGVDENGELRPPCDKAPDQYKNVNGNMIPRNWEISGLSEKASPDRPYLKTGPFGSSLKGEHWVEEGVPVITIGALGEGFVIEPELLKITRDYASVLHEYSTAVGDIVFSRVADVGRSVVITEKEAGWIISSNLMRISLDNRKADPYYTYLCFAFNEQLRSQIRQSVNSGGREIANSEVLNRLYLSWPPVEEQKRIGSVAQSLDAIIRSERFHMRKLQTIKSGLMQDLLTGKVRVNVDESTESERDVGVHQS